MPVGSDANQVVSFGHSVVNELFVLERQLVEASLDNVVAVRVLDEYHNVRFERRTDGIYFVLSVHIVDDLLDSTRAMDVHAHGNEVSPDASQHVLPLLLCAALYHFLAQVVPKRVCHEPAEVGRELLEYQRCCDRIPLVELPLEVPAAVLVPAEVVDVPGVVLDGVVVVPVVNPRGVPHVRGLAPRPYVHGNCHDC